MWKMLFGKKNSKNTFPKHNFGNRYVYLSLKKWFNCYNSNYNYLFPNAINTINKLA